MVIRTLDGDRRRLGLHMRTYIFFALPAIGPRTIHQTSHQTIHESIHQAIRRTVREPRY